MVTLKALQCYTDGSGARVAIAGLTGGEVNGMPVFWSIQGDHYTESGAFVFTRLNRPSTDVDCATWERFLRPGSIRDIVAEDNSPEAAIWLMGLANLFRPW